VAYLTASANPVTELQTQAAMRQADDIIAGRVPAKLYNSLDELLASLLSGVSVVHLKHDRVSCCNWS